MGKYKSNLPSIFISDPKDPKLVIGSIPDMGRPGALLAVRRASAFAYKWRTMNMFERDEVMQSWRDEIINHHHDFQHLVATEQGLSMKEADAEVKTALKSISIAMMTASGYPSRLWTGAGTCAVIMNDTAASSFSSLAVNAILPLATGCTVVIRASSVSPFTTIAVLQLADLVGVPKGVLNVVTGDLKTTRDAIISYPSVRRFVIDPNCRPKGLAPQEGEKSDIPFQTPGQHPDPSLLGSYLVSTIFDEIKPPFRQHGADLVLTKEFNVDEAFQDAARIHSQRKATLNERQAKAKSEVKPKSR